MLQILVTKWTHMSPQQAYHTR